MHEQAYVVTKYENEKVTIDDKGRRRLAAIRQVPRSRPHGPGAATLARGDVWSLAAIR
jgi:hypothetical protein